MRDPALDAGGEHACRRGASEDGEGYRDSAADRREAPGRSPAYSGDERMAWQARVRLLGACFRCGGDHAVEMASSGFGIGSRD